jgi:Transposase DDE domain group 1
VAQRRNGWPAELRYIVRRVKPSRRHAKKPTEFEKATGLRKLPFHGYERNNAWLMAANIASDLIAYLQLLGVDEHRELASAAPESLRTMVLHIPARLVTHARQRILKIERNWLWATAVAEAWQRLGVIPAPAAPATATPHPSPHTARTNTANRAPAPASRTHKSRDHHGRRIEVSHSVSHSDDSEPYTY